MIAALLRALAKALGPAAIGGDRGAPTSTTPAASTERHARGCRPRQVGGELGPFGANAHGDADSNMLSYQANGHRDGGRGDRVRRAGRRPAARDRAGRGRAGRPPRRHVVMRDSLWLRPAAHYLMSIR